MEASSGDILPPVELPAPIEQLAAAAALELGWNGEVLPPMTLFGRYVSVVARLRPDAHAERLCFGAQPELDRTTVATWVWPEMAKFAPPTAAEIIGVFSVTRHWRTALASAAPFAKWSGAAIVLPWEVASSTDFLVRCLPRTQRHGVSVLTANPDGDVTVNQVNRREPGPHEHTAASRWVNEMVYARLLEAYSATSEFDMAGEDITADQP
ncbi:MAG: hypothetical protein J2O49_07010 [Sciscionella sp.]|nr:hypothetical protein [Sciscionella sp.]